MRTFGPNDFLFILEAARWTLALSLIAFIGGAIGGLVVALSRTSDIPWLRSASAAFIQLFFFFFALPAIGLRWSAHTAALTAMIVNLGAYATEIIRAGIEAIPKGQIEAGLALNLKAHEIFRFVVLKPALKAIFPALTSQFILLMLSSSVVSVISADDLTSVASNLQSQTFRSFEIYIVVAAIYLALALSFSALFRTVYRRAFNYPDRR